MLSNLPLQSKTQTQLIKGELMGKAIEYSSGENAFRLHDNEFI